MDILTNNNEQRNTATNGHSQKKAIKKPIVYNLIPYPESEP